MPQLSYLPGTPDESRLESISCRPKPENEAVLVSAEMKPGSEVVNMVWQDKYGVADSNKKCSILVSAEMKNVRR